MTIKELIDTHGLKEISTTTRISNDNLLNLLNEDYKLMSKANTLGFIKILEKEYDVDLSKVTQSVKEGAKDEDYIPKDLVLTERRYGSKKKFTNGALIFVVLLAGLIYVVYLINAQNGSDTGSVLALQNDEVEVVEVEPLNPFLQELAMQSESMEIVATTQDEQDIEKSENIKMSQTQEVVEVQSAAEDPVEENFLSVATEEVVEVDIAPQEQEVTQEVAAPQVIETFLVEEVVILPNQRAWLGYINLDTNERTQRNNANEMIIDEDNTIIVTGHGRMQVAGKDFNTGDRLFFHFVGGELKRLNESAFRELNGGRIW